MPRISAPVKLLSYGDLIEKGEYKLHYRFEHAVNLRKGQALLTILPAGRPAGPFNLVLEELPEKVSKVVFDGKSFTINGDRVALPRGSRYESRLAVAGIPAARLTVNLQELRRIVCASAPTKSAVFLLDADREKHFRSGFERRFVKRMKEAAVNLAMGAYEAGAAGMKGLGFGMTPSGDDFLGGYMLGINAAELYSGKNLGLVKERVYTASLGSNLVSNAFLAASFKGRADERVNGVIKALFSASGRATAKAAEELLAVGHTSGGDIAAGFLYGFYGVMNI
ncbi:MAG TPA: DUF2877 domain-containing protein [Elusimicrobiales bacterium]|nr:DUF2877 domain-containing protein [Elusimicrobiales bacterium]